MSRFLVQDFLGPHNPFPGPGITRIVGAERAVTGEWYSEYNDSAWGMHCYYGVTASSWDILC